MRLTNLPVLIFALLTSTARVLAQTPAAASQAPPHLTVAGHINVTSYKPQPYPSTDGFTLAATDIIEDFSGDFSGTGTSHLLVATESATGSMHFTGMERFSGSLGKASGSFLFQNSGTLVNGVLHSTWHIIPGSGTGALAGIRGEGGCNPQGCHLDYWFPAPGS